MRLRKISKPFVHCVALLEQELHRHLEDRANTSNTDRPTSLVRRRPRTAVVRHQVPRR
jgi:hypothetical protein